MTEWNFDNVTFKNAVCLPQKTMEHLNQLNNPQEAMRRLNREYDQIPFLQDNAHRFKEQGLLESAVAEIYIMLLAPCMHWNISVWRDLFDMCDRQLLLMAPGQPFCPLQQDEFVIYRGCAEAEITSLSWTVSPEQARRDCESGFTDREQGAKVFKAIATLNDVAFFTNDRGKLEVVLHPGSSLFAELAENAQQVEI